MSSAASGHAVVTVVILGDPTIGWAETIDSVAAQRVPGIEVIVAAPQDAEVPMQAAGLELARCPPAPSRGALLGCALELAKGKHVAFLVPPDRWHSGKLEAQLKELESNPGLDAVFSQATFEPDKNPLLNFAYPQARQLDDFLGLLVSGAQVAFSSIVVRREKIMERGLPDPGLRVVPELDLLLRLGAGGVARGLNQPLVTRMPPAEEASPTARRQEEEQVLEAAAIRFRGTAAGTRIAESLARRCYRQAKWRETYDDAAAARRLYWRAMTTAPRSKWCRRAAGHLLLTFAPRGARDNPWRIDRILQARMWAEGLQLPGTATLKDSMIGEISSYLGWPGERAMVFCDLATDLLAGEWDRQKPSDEGEIVSFYDQRALGYIGELTYWHTLEDLGGGPLNYVTALECALDRGAKRYLDFGGGVGSSAIVFARHGIESAVADISGPLLSFARWRFQQRALRAQIVDLKCDKLPENAYDIATAFDVLEHVPDPISVLRDLHRCLSPDGVLMLNLPGPEVGDRPMHYAHDENALLAEAAGMGFRQRRSRDRGLWLFEKFAR